MSLRYGEISAPTTAQVAETALAEPDASPAPARWATPQRSSLYRPVPFSSINLHGLNLHVVTEKQAINHVLDQLDAGEGGVVVTPNLDHLYRYVRDLSFSALVNDADLVLADGMPLVWAARLQGTPLPGRVAGSDLIWTLSEAAATRGKSIFMLGGAPGTAVSAAKVLQQRYPDIKIVGTCCPEPGFEHRMNEMAAIVKMLEESKPDIVYVALGSPKQEYLIDRLRQVLPQAWWLGVGISFSFVSGDVKRAPVWLQKIGLEWLHRLVQEPRRLFKRYVIIGLPFAVSLLTRAASNRTLGWLGRPSSFEAGTVSTTLARYPRVNGNGHAGGNGHEKSNGKGSIGTADAPAVITRVDVTSAAQALSRVRSLILLGGSVRPTDLTQSIGRSLLDLPLDDSGSILNHWLAHASELARYAGMQHLPVRVMVDKTSPEPHSMAPRFGDACRVERDLSEYRGTGGVLHDLADEYEDDDLLLVANAAQVLLDPLSVIAAALEHKRGDVNLISHQDGTPSGVMLLRCRTLRSIASTGFVDMKEQALPEISKSFAVKVLHCRRASGLPVRTLNDYLGALRHYHRRKVGKPASIDPLAEDWQPTFAIVEDGAVVGPRAHIHDSVVLKGGVVESGAALVRCLVCPGGSAKQKSTIVDSFVRPTRAR
jgi:N-acetylglucosaminyldiphosphoundecaprenol N-acetyl-beta-D-mannosaminyltransferase